jgi:hypothetical protein
VAPHGLSDIALLSQLVVYVDRLHNLTNCPMYRSIIERNWHLCNGTDRFALILMV